MVHQYSIRLILQHICTVSVTATLVIVPPLPSIAVECRSAADADAVHMRSLQSELMVAALSCRAKPLYNDFARRFEPVLVESGRRLRTMFRRDHAADDIGALDRFITLLANDASARVIAIGKGYCQLSVALYEEVMTLPSKALAGYSYQRTFNSHAVPDTCKHEAALAHNR